MIWEKTGLILAACRSKCYCIGMLKIINVVIKRSRWIDQLQRAGNAGNRYQRSVEWALEQLAETYYGVGGVGIPSLSGKESGPNQVK